MVRLIGTTIRRETELSTEIFDGQEFVGLENFPKVKVVAQVPSASLQLPRADYNIVLNDWDEWPSLLAATAS